MKKTYLFMAVICAACAVILSCTKEEDKQEAEVINNTSESPSEIERGDGVYSITLSFPETKTAFGDTYTEGGHTVYKKFWTVGDKIRVNGQESLELLAGHIDEDKRIATFHFADAIPSAAAYQVVYPSSAYDTSTEKVTIPAEQRFTSATFDPDADIILGYGTDLGSITLSNAVAYLKIKLTKGDYGNFGVKSVKITAAGKKLNGAFEIADGGLALTVPSSSETASEQAITLDASAINPHLSDSETVFLLAVAPQTLSGGFTVTITDTKDNTMEKTKPSSAELAAGGILAQPAFKFDEYRAIATPADLLAFADACSAGDSNYWLITDNIDMDGQTWPVAGVGDDDLTVDPAAFRGTLNGGNNGTENGGYKISHLTSTTGAFMNYLAKNAVVKNLTLDSTCSIGYSADITANTCIGMIGMSRGLVSYCFSRASVSCTSASYSGGIWLGGIVARQYRTGSIDHCYNYGTVSCTPTGGSKVVHVGGVLGSLERVKSKDSATISNCENNNNITANPDINSILHLGGVIGRIDHYQGSLSITGLINTGNVTRTNSDQKNLVAVVVGGLIGGVHGDNLADPVTSTTIKNSHVSDCTVQNGTFNNTDSANGDNYNKATHVGGFIGFIMGSGTGGSQLVVIDDNCYVSNVDVISRRGYLGGFVSYAKGVKIDNCSVLESAAQGSLNRAYYGGGIIACGEDVIVSNCDVTLTKNADHSLYTNGSQFYTGGIAGWTKGTSTIDNCRAFVRNMYQGTDTPGMRGWIVGYNTGTLNIKNCSLGGTYGNSTPTITLDEDNFSDYVYGSSSDPQPTLEGTQHYWDGTI